MSDLVFGPVPSRRLGSSIGINNIPPKNCSYACVYCQLGKAIKMDADRKAFYAPREVINAVKERVRIAESNGDEIDYLTFVPDGEATLDLHLGEIIEGLKPLNQKLAIITNSSLIDRADVREELMQLDLVSLKVDAITGSVWRKTDHPHRALELNRILEGIELFAGQYLGKLITETMLIEGYNDQTSELNLLADFIGTINPHTAYISIPTRSPARKDVKPAAEETINRACQIFSSKIRRVEYLVGHEGNAFAHTGDTRSDLLSITAVHPMRADSVKAFLEKDGETWSLVQELIDDGALLETFYNGYHFYVRKLKQQNQF